MEEVGLDLDVPKQHDLVTGIVDWIDRDKHFDPVVEAV